jgi:hypothetical protein
MPSLLTYVNQRNLTKEQCRRLWSKRHPAPAPATARHSREVYDKTARLVERKMEQENG